MSQNPHKNRKVQKEFNILAKYDLTQHPNYKYTADFDKKNTFDVEKYLDRRMKLHADDEFDLIEAGD